MHKKPHEAVAPLEIKMKNEIKAARVESIICSAARSADGEPIWILSKDGGIFISQKAVADATIGLAHIKN
jgi:hypothetical protein